MPSIIQVHNLRKTYGSVVAADDISVAVHPSEIFGLLGPNGAGKTTTLECLEGIRQPDRGDLAVLGADSTRQPGRLRRLIGVQLSFQAGIRARLEVFHSYPTPFANSVSTCYSMTNRFL